MYGVGCDNNGNVLSNNDDNNKPTTFRGNQHPAAASENDLSLERPGELIGAQVVETSCLSCCNDNLGDIIQFLDTHFCKLHIAILIFLYIFLPVQKLFYNFAASIQTKTVKTLFECEVEKCDCDAFREAQV